MSRRIFRMNLSSVTKDKTSIGYIIFVTGLTILSVYNVYSVVYEFLLNNEVTEVIKAPLQSIFPIVPSISLYYRFYNKGIFPETWSMTDEELDQLLPSRTEDSPEPDGGWPAIKRLASRKDEASFRAKSGQLPLESLIDVASFADIAYQMDDHFIRCGDSLSDNSTSKGFSKTDSTICGNYSGELTPDLYPFPVNASMRPLIMSALDQFVSRSYGKKFTEQAVSKVVNGDYWGRGPLSTVPLRTLVDGIGAQGIAVTVPFDFVGNGSDAKMNPVFELLPISDNTTIFPELDKVRMWLGEMNLLRTFEPHRSFSYWDREDLLPAAVSVPWMIPLKNIGVYNSSEVRRQGKCDVCGPWQTVHECIFQCKLDSVVKECGCVPFTYRRLYGHATRGKRNRYCTSKDYKSCYLSGKYIPSKCTGDAYVPCVMIDNDFDTPDDTIERQSRYKLSCRVLWFRSAYVTYQARVKDSWMEMLGQLGGNLGLFLSFSLLGVWKLIIRTFAWYRKLRKKKFTSGSANELPSFLWSWIQWEKTGAEIDTMRLLVEQEFGIHTKALQSWIKEMQRKYEVLMNENEQLKALMDEDERQKFLDGNDDPSLRHRT